MSSRIPTTVGFTPERLPPLYARLDSIAAFAEELVGLPGTSENGGTIWQIWLDLF